MTKKEDEMERLAEERLEDLRKRLSLAPSGEYENGVNAGFAAMIAGILNEALVIPVEISHLATGKIRSVWSDMPYTESRYSKIRFFKDGEKGRYYPDCEIVDGWPSDRGDAIAIILVLPKEASDE